MSAFIYKHFLDFFFFFRERMRELKSERSESFKDFLTCSCNLEFGWGRLQSLGNKYCCPPVLLGVEL